MKKLTIFILLLFTFWTTTAFAGPYMTESNFRQWQNLLEPPTEEYNSIRPMQIREWAGYMEAWKNPDNQVEGEKYPETEFIPLDPDGLYASQMGMGGNPPLDEPGSGLVMAWGQEIMAPGSYASAWLFTYGTDPDLTNKTISITVFPPQWGPSGQITQVSFGMIDTYGNIRSWYWNCGPGPGMLPWNTSTTVSIDTTIAGMGAASPPASGYLNTPAFDLTKVLNFIVDENAVWTGGPTPVPPDGVNVGRIWNYWKDLMVMPQNPIANKGYYIKYSQPVQEEEPGIILGWDEKSIYRPDDIPIMADDFLCSDDRPITDFHWWGSFLGWNQSSLPPVLPIAFHIGIWSDVPDPDPLDPTNWSKPGTLLWKHVCTNWTWNFAGFDRHPENLPEFKNEACFQFNQLLNEIDWYYQEPGENVYWLSIAAIYPDNIEFIEYPWGWKTRPHQFNDPAFRIAGAYNQTGLFTWPPQLHDTVSAGNSVLLEENQPWDLAFEISTNKPAYHDEPAPGDIDANGIVDLLDFAQLAQNWLKTFP
ncbi:MAG: hypothetical protein JW745_09050 [Sedimentisphaerales bacterium]|nr:hypothetical protein [Sedimentisphaerales bacterium]MBN2844017.1 hypothetical protein [Sedimentisphaerales bacterium]